MGILLSVWVGDGKIIGWLVEGKRKWNLHWGPIWVGDETPTEVLESYVFIYTLHYTKENVKLASYLYINNNTTFIFPINETASSLSFNDGEILPEWVLIYLRGVFLFWSPSKIFDMEMELEWNGKWSLGALWTG